MPSTPDNSNAIKFRCEGTIDPHTGAIEVRSVDCNRMPDMETVLKRRLESLRRWSFSRAKFGILVLLVFFATILAALYGALYDQFSYTVVPEYFTEIQSRQISVARKLGLGDRVGAALVGVTHAWWTGTIAGLLLGTIGMIHPEKTMFRRTFRALFIVLFVVVVFGIFGLLLGEVLVSLLIDSNRIFVAVVMHAAGYLGGLLGLLVGIADLRRIAYVVQ